jgi:hypothetical protein
LTAMTLPAGFLAVFLPINPVFRRCERLGSIRLLLSGFGFCIRIPAFVAAREQKC